MANLPVYRQFKDIFLQYFIRLCLKTNMIRSEMEERLRYQKPFNYHRRNKKKR